MVKKRFSVYQNKVSFQDEVLRIEGRKLVTLLFLVSFFAAVCWVFLTVSMPAVIRVGVALAGVVLFWALFDVAFSTGKLIFDPKRRWVSVRRSSFRKSFVFQGENNDFLRVARRRAIVDATEDTYEVRLVFETDEVEIPFLLEFRELEKEESVRRAKEWCVKLQLPQPSDSSVGGATSS